MKIALCSDHGGLHLKNAIIDDLSKRGYEIKDFGTTSENSCDYPDYALLAADQNLPTILMEYDYPKLAQWADDGYLTTYDLNEFAQVAPTYYQRMVDLNQIGYTQMNCENFFALA